MKREQEKGTALTAPLPCVHNMVPSMTLFAARNSHLLPDPQNWATLHLFVWHMSMRARQAVPVFLQFLRWCWFGESCMLYSWRTGLTCAGEPLSPRGVPCPLLAIRRVCICVCCAYGEGRNCFANRWLAHLMSQEKVKGKGVSACRGVAEGGPLGWGCCAGCLWAGFLPFSGSSLAFYFGRLIPAWFLSAGWFFTHVVNRHELAEIKNFCTVAKLFSCWWQNACSWWHYQ